jgi:hypothetical protein
MWRLYPDPADRVNRLDQYAKELAIAVNEVDSLIRSTGWRGVTKGAFLALLAGTAGIVGGTLLGNPFTVVTGGIAVEGGLLQIQGAQSQRRRAMTSPYAYVSLARATLR